MPPWALALGLYAVEGLVDTHYFYMGRSVMGHWIYVDVPYPVFWTQRLDQGQRMQVGGKRMPTFKGGQLIGCTIK